MRGVYLCGSSFGLVKISFVSLFFICLFSFWKTTLLKIIAFSQVLKYGQICFFLKWRKSWLKCTGYHRFAPRLKKNSGRACLRTPLAVVCAFGAAWVAPLVPRPGLTFCVCVFVCVSHPCKCNDTEFGFFVSKVKLDACSCRLYPRRFTGLF